MRRSVVAIIIIAIIFAGAFIYVALNDDLFLLEEPLRLDEPITEEVSDNRAEYVASFRHDRDDVNTTAAVRISSVSDGLYEMRVSISHQTNTRLDSLSLSFDFQQVAPPLALQLPGGYPWPPLQFQQTTEAGGAVVDIPDLGFQGTGTVTLDFLLGPVADAQVLPDTFWIRIDVTMYQDRAPYITDYRAEASIDVQVPSATTMSR